MSPYKYAKAILEDARSFVLINIVLFCLKDAMLSCISYDLFSISSDSKSLCVMTAMSSKCFPQRIDLEVRVTINQPISTDTEPN